MTAQRSFHLLFLGMTLCLLASVVSKVVEKSDNGIALKPDTSISRVSFWKDVAKDVMPRP